MMSLPHVTAELLVRYVSGGKRAKTVDVGECTDIQTGCRASACAAGLLRHNLFRAAFSVPDDYVIWTFIRASSSF